MHADVFQHSPVRHGYKRRRCHELSVAQKVGIVHDVVVGKDRHQDVADAYNVKAAAVSHLVRKARAEPQHLRRQLQQHSSRGLLRERIEREVL